MTSTLEDDGTLTQDAFLGGRVLALQPKDGYRAGVDAVFLAAACPARVGESVLELGCGVGVAALCLAERSSASVTGVERQPRYADLARRNGVDVVEADLTQLPAWLRQKQFDHVIMNPPYFDTSRGAQPADEGRAAARGEETPLAHWLDVAARRLRAKGSLTLIHRVERLPDVLASVGKTLGSVEVLPLQPRVGREVSLLLLRARKDGRAPFRLHAPFQIHAAARHEGDHPDYTPAVAGVLQDAHAISFPD